MGFASRHLIVLIVLLLMGGAAHGHPLTQGSLDVTVLSDRVDVIARVTIEEVGVTNLLVEKDPLKPVPSSDTPEAFDLHAQYLVDHIQIVLDGKPLAGSIVRVTPPADVPAGVAAQINPTTIPTTVPTALKRMAIYQLTYRSPSPTSDPPKSLQVRSTVLTDVQFLPATKWEASYVVNVKQGDRIVDQALLLTSREPVIVSLPEPSASPSQEEPRANRGRLLREYFIHGAQHILGKWDNGWAGTGWDHLLFISALTLAATTLWDLLKVVTAFTIAHTVTLTLAALQIFHLPGWVVEPMIALSIVVVALQNVIWPKRSRGWIRLAAAFFFGLFHGLGFAGGLLDAMQGMSGPIVAIAILGFSIGVEVGHQVIVIPLFTALKLVRKARETPHEKERLSFHAQRIGSAVISIAGMYYLFEAVHTTWR